MKEQIRIAWSWVIWYVREFWRDGSLLLLLLLAWFLLSVLLQVIWGVR